MDADEFILTVNPDPTRGGARIERTKYELVRDAIIENLQDYGPMTLSQLGSLVEDQLRVDFDGSVMWYYTKVKMDMEARGEIRRAPKFDQQLAR